MKGRCNPVNDKSMIALFEQRNEQGIAEANRAYGGLLHTIAMHILHDSRDAEECVNDTMLKAWNTIPPQKPKYFSAFLAKLTRNLALNRYAEEHAAKRGGGAVPVVLEELAECISSQSDTEQVLDRMALTDALERFLASLPKQHAQIFMRRYFTMLEAGEIAAELSVSENTVRSTLRRTREKLQVFLVKEELI